MKKLLMYALVLALMASAPMAGAQGEKTELYILAAASLTEVMERIGELYREAHPGTELTFVFDSSGTLQSQIEAGAPADVFVSAAQKQMDALEGQGLIDPDSRVDLLANRVVLIVPENSELELESFEEAAQEKVGMIAIGEASVPVGQYTQEIYERLGLWEAIRAKANLGVNVRAVLAWVESGDVDCGIVYATDAAASGKVRVAASAPEGSHKPVIYPAALIAAGRNKAEAQSFLDFLGGEEARALFEQAGFEMVGD